MNSLLNIYGIKSKNIFGLQVFFLFGVSFFVWVSFQVIINNAGKSSISHSCSDFFSTLDACIFFAVDKFCEAPSAKSVVARLNRDWDGHDLIAKGACNLVFDWLCKFGCHFFFSLSLLFFLFFFLFLFNFLLLPLFLLFFLLLFLFFLLFLFLLFGRQKFDSKAYCLFNRHLTGS